jgi:hypothetical protein
MGLGWLANVCRLLMIGYVFRVCWTLVILASSAASATIESTEVLFRNTGLETVFIVTDIGHDRTRKNFRLAPKEIQPIAVGNNLLMWCSYKDENAPPCAPSNPASGGSGIDVK